MNSKFWVINGQYDRQLYSELMNSGIGTLTSKIMASRLNVDRKHANAFLNPQINELIDPFLFKDMEKTVHMILETGFKGKHILVYGDYDVDGVTGCSMLVNFLRSLNFSVSCYIPDRMTEGYGFSPQSTENVIEIHPDLVVTVDCGITAKEYIQELNDQGIQVIVTDHHEPMEDKIPDCYSILAVSLADSGYPFRYLCGAGVVFKLITAICRILDEKKDFYPVVQGSNIRDRYLEYLDLTALGTVADVVSLTGENRIIVKYGLEQITHTLNVGLKELIRVSDIKGKTIDTYHVGFVLGPRLNAAGRVGSAYRAVELLTSSDRSKCMAIAEELNDENTRRQSMQDTIFKEADLLIKKQNDLDKDKVLVVAKEDWHHGIIGIVSSKITDKYCLPSILLSVEETQAKGSGRSVKNFNLFKALLYSEQYLERYGGHEAAAGMSLKAEYIDGLRISLNWYAEQTTGLVDLIPTLYIDTQVALKDVTVDNITDMESLQPFGEGNKEPVFLCEDMQVVQCKMVGRDKNHLSLRLKQGNVYVDAIGFNMSDFYEYIGIGTMIHGVFSISVNEWNGRRNPSLKLLDIKFTDPEKIKSLFYNHFTVHIEFEKFKGYNSIKELEDKIQYVYLTVANKKLEDGELTCLVKNITNIDRDTLVPVYKYIRHKRPVMFNCRCGSLSEELHRLTGIYINPIKLLICIKILYDTGVITATEEADYMKFAENKEQDGKIELENSQIYLTMNQLNQSMRTG